MVLFSYEFLVFSNKREGKVIVWNTIIVTSLDIKVFSLLYFLVIFSEDVMHYSMFLLL